MCSVAGAHFVFRELGGHGFAMAQANIACCDDQISMSRPVLDA